MKPLKKKTKIILISVASVILVAAIAVGGFFLGTEIAYRNATDGFTVYDFDPNAETTGDRIHFLNTGSSDAIILESNGHFAMIDAGEDSDNPRGFSSLEAKGYEEEVLNYLKTRCGRNGKVTLDFILGTHAHSDHIGGFDTVVADDEVIVKRAYLKRYRPEIITDYEKTKWDNQEVYDQMREALQKKNVEIAEELPEEEFRFENLTIRFVNQNYDTEHKNIGENDNAVGTIVSKNGVNAFLAADMDNKTGDEARLAPEIGKVDLLKLGHHGYAGSTTQAFLNVLNPTVAVATNRSGSMTPDVKLRLKLSRSVILATADNDGVIAEFKADGFIYYRSIYQGVDRI